jgi:hypothetical protein
MKDYYQKSMRVQSLATCRDERAYPTMLHQIRQDACRLLSQDSGFDQRAGAAGLFPAPL